MGIWGKIDSANRIVDNPIDIPEGITDVRNEVQKSIPDKLSEVLYQLNNLRPHQIDFDIHLDSGRKSSVDDLLKDSVSIINETDKISISEESEFLVALVIAAIQSNKYLDKSQKYGLVNTFRAILE